MRFACWDWSGAAVANPPGLALAVAELAGPPRLIDRRWSREDALAWLRDIAASNEPVLIGLDLSPAFPFDEAGGYFPGWPESPRDPHALWALVDELAARDPHLAAATPLRHPEIARHFRQHRALGDRFGTGRLRAVERRMRELRLANPSSCFNLVGAAQVGKSSLTGMRVLHRLGGAIPVWPIDPLPPAGPVIVEVYPKLAAIAARVPGGRKLRDQAGLTTALQELGSDNHAPLDRYTDHVTDAILTAAWLRAVADRPELWSPPTLTSEIARTEGWTFGVP